MRKLGAAAPLQCASLCESVHVAMKLCGARREFNGTLIASCKSLERRSFRWKATAKRRLQRQEVFDPCTSDQPIAARIVSLLDGDSLDAVYRDWPRSDAAPMARVSRSADTDRWRSAARAARRGARSRLGDLRRRLREPVLSSQRSRGSATGPDRQSIHTQADAWTALTAGWQGSKCFARWIERASRHGILSRSSRGRTRKAVVLRPARGLECVRRSRVAHGYRESRDAGGIRFGDALDEALPATPVIAVT
ncbi:hypothetical protein HDG34_005303 [Paraburkholderia sp. HC6.4b]|nr:hypothetical protein [Paraburkholderia sp. HC6.4b]MBB5449877.1 hypothetical protein [Paraburkholderia sp. Kb1A]